MNKSVFVVEQGSWEEYEVIGVYEKKEDAERIAAAINNSGYLKYDKAAVDERELNPGIDHLEKGENLYQVEMANYGIVISIEKIGFDPGGLVFFQIYTNLVNILDGEGRVEVKTIEGQVWAKDEREAIQITNEYRIDAIMKGDLPGATEARNR